jgi:hypothetical protein
MKNRGQILLNSLSSIHNAPTGGTAPHAAWWCTCNVPDEPGISKPTDRVDRPGKIISEGTKEKCTSRRGEIQPVFVGKFFFFHSFLDKKIDIFLRTFC